MTNTASTSARYLSLDVLRGLTVALMIVVNSPGSWSAIYAPFRHADWHGFTLTDLVFPTFLFVVGNAMSFSMKKAVQSPPSQFFKKVFSRTVKIFLIGLLLHLFPFVNFTEEGVVLKSFREVRIFGVLQRIALCYFFGSAIVYYFRSTKTLLLICAGILLGYWLVLYLYGLNNEPYELATNAVTLLDNFLFSPQNLYGGYGIPFEPEGVLSTPPTIVSVIAGYLVGRFIQEKGNNKRTFYSLAGIGVPALLLALLWNQVMPFNKPIWTSSYILYAIGWDLLLTAALMWIIDIMQVKRWTYFFEVFGKNPLFIYILAWVILKTFHLIPVNGSTLTSLYYKKVLLSWFPDKTASLLFAITYMLLLWVIGSVLDRKKIYVKV